MKSITQSHILIVLLFLGAALLSSCDNSTQTQKLTRENQEKQEKIDEQTKEINRLEERLSKIENQQNSEPSYNGKEEGNNSNYGSQYYFVVLEVIEKHYPNNEQFYYTTQVNQISNYNDNIKYRLLDEVVTKYKNSPSGMAFNGNVRKRDIYLFNSYEEASKAREKYIMN